MPDSAAFIVIAPSARLGREVAAKGFEPIRLRSLDGVRKKLREHPAAFLLFEWDSADGETPLKTLTALKWRFPAFSFAVFCPNLPERTMEDAETLRFLFLESGAIAVFANRRELVSLSTIIRNSGDAYPRPKNALTSDS